MSRHKGFVWAMPLTIILPATLRAYPLLVIIPRDLNLLVPLRAMHQVSLSHLVLPFLPPLPTVYHPVIPPGITP